MKSRVLAGTLLFVATAQFVLFLNIAEAEYTGYSTHASLISDLGVWGEPSAIFFNLSVIAYSLLSLIAGVVLREDKGLSYIPWLLMVAGVGGLSIGIFPMTVWGVHDWGAVLAFVFAALAAVYCYWALSGPFRYISIVLGVISFFAMILYKGNVFLGLGAGGMERMIMYPILIWIAGLGTVLFTSKEPMKG
ncbi:MAG: DUF998 domain-containing protein [Methanomassiliicoccales archaeon]|nr:DUF998 domain-containing protein [Methanomassiliicoccales archaeon]